MTQTNKPYIIARLFFFRGAFCCDTKKKNSHQLYNIYELFIYISIHIIYIPSLPPPPTFLYIYIYIYIGTNKQPIHIFPLVLYFI
ncbi:hypothetical protein BDC45DRAFT_305628 [Circinella umbellata]|nr:hypothetical protein BDC45DRAFT_305628 [Circinella umbellata]